MKIVNARIDMRLIHGQVATMWTRMLPVDRIMVIDDAVIDNAMEKSMLKMACQSIEWKVWKRQHLCCGKKPRDLCEGDEAWILCGRDHRWQHERKRRSKGGP